MKMTLAALSAASLLAWAGAAHADVADDEVYRDQPRMEDGENYGDAADPVEGDYDQYADTGQWYDDLLRDRYAYEGQEYKEEYEVDGCKVKREWERNGGYKAEIKCEGERE